MKNLTWQNPEQLFVAQELINKVKSKCCGIKVNNLDMGSVGGAMWGMGANAGGASISGCLALIDKSSNTPVSVVLIKGIQGKGTNGFIIYGEFKRMNLAFEKLAEGMAKTR